MAFRKNTAGFRRWRGVALYIGSDAPEIEGVWTDDDDWLIDGHGWRIGTTDEGMWTILTTREAKDYVATKGVNFFLTDGDASDFVYKKAAEGSDIHKRAVACVAARNMGISTDE